MSEQTSQHEVSCRLKPNSAKLRITISEEVTGLILIWNYVWEPNLMRHIMVARIQFHCLLQKIYHFDFWLVLEKMGAYFTERGLKTLHT